MNQLKFNEQAALNALLDKTKTRTIRKAFEIKTLDENYKCNDCGMKGQLEGTYDKPCKYKEGEIVEVIWTGEDFKFGYGPYWNLRWGKRKKIQIEMESNWDDLDRLLALLKHWQYCGGIGHTASTSISMDGDGTSHPKFIVNGKDIKEYQNKFLRINSKDEFEKIKGWDMIKTNHTLGKVKITKIEKIESHKKDSGTSSVSRYITIPGNPMPDMNWVESLSKSEGFNSVEEMFEYLEKYDGSLEETKPFWLVSHEWVRE